MQLTMNMSTKDWNKGYFNAPGITYNYINWAVNIYNIVMLNYNSHKMMCDCKWQMEILLELE